MKKLLSTILVSATLVSISCKKDKIEEEVTNVSSTYKTLIIEYTADWCPPCGTNSYPAFKAIAEQNPYDMCLLNIHPSDDVSSGNAPSQADIKTYYGFSGTPSGSFNHFKINGSGIGGSTSMMINQMQQQINLGKKVVAKAGVGISKTISGNTIEIKTKTVFFEDLSGTYNVAVYITENGLISDQTTNSSPIKNARHDNVFKGSANGAFGKLVANNPSKGTTVDDTHTFTITNDIKNSSNIQVVAVIWKMNGKDPVDMINSNKE